MAHQISRQDLRWALANGGFETLFQPIVCLHTHRPVALEALARLNHPDRGTIQPDHFVPQMEDAGLALALADQITAHALTALPADFLTAHRLSIAINLPLDVLLHPDALIRIEALRIEHDVPNHCLTIELTESQPVTDVPALHAAIERWAAAGYALALDDVGPDMPYCRALLQLPFAAVKLDKGVVGAALRHPDGRDFAGNTIAAAAARGLTVIAEGVEDEAGWGLMHDLGADQVQGFLVAKPMSGADLPGWLQNWHPPA